MAVSLTDIRCPQCAKKLAEKATITQGELRIMCPRCKRVFTIKL